MKPFTRGEAFGVLAAATMVDCNAALIVVVSADGFAARMVRACMRSEGYGSGDWGGWEVASLAATPCCVRD